MIVVDASMIGPLLLPDERESMSASKIDAVFSTPFVVPMHWHLEVASIIDKAIRRGRIDLATGLDLLRGNDRLQPEIDPETITRVWTVTFPLAQRLGLTVYDAAYLELASRRRASLATLDKALAQAADREGIALVRLP